MYDKAKSPVPPSAMRRAAAALSGIALALCGAGAAQAQAGPQIPPPDAFNPVDARGVNLYSGSYAYTTTPISMGPAGQGGLSYSAGYDTASGKWRNSLAGMVVRQPFTGSPPTNPYYTVTVMGASHVFLPLVGGAFEAVDGDGTLEKPGGQMVYTALDGSVATFGGGVTYSPFVANEGLISTLVRPNGERIVFTYTAITMTSGFQARRLQSVTNNHGYQIHFQYASNVWSADWYRTVTVTALNNAVDACAPTANTCVFSRTWPSLTFAESASEKSVTDALGRTTRLLFSGGRLTGLRRPTLSTGQNVSLTYDAGGTRIASVNDGSGSWSYTYTPSPVVSPPPYQETMTTLVRDPLAHTTEAVLTATQVDMGVTDYRVVRPLTVTDDLNNTTQYNYPSPDFRLADVTYPEGDRRQYGWTARGDLVSVTRKGKPGSGLADTTIGATLTAGCPATPALCGRPATITDARGAVTTFTYSSTHGGVLSVTAPAPTPGAVQPQTRTAYASHNAWTATAWG